METDLSEPSVTPAKQPPFFAWILRGTDDANDNDVSKISLVAGITGMVVICIAASIWCALGITFLNQGNVFGDWFFGAGIFAISVYVPPPVIVTVSVAAPMLLAKPLAWRFVIAAGVALVGWLSIYFAVSISTSSGSSESVSVFFRAVAIHSFLITAVALAFQLWTPWSLKEYRTTETDEWRLGTRDLFTLTLAGALFCSVFVGLDNRSIAAIMMFCAVGVFGGGFACGLLLVFLAGRYQTGWFLAIASVVALFAILSTVQFFASTGSGANLLELAHVFIGLGIALVIVIASSSWVVAKWLAVCGWKCIGRRKSRQVGHPIAGPR